MPEIVLVSHVKLNIFSLFDLFPRSNSVVPFFTCILTVNISGKPKKNSKNKPSKYDRDGTKCYIIV